MSAEIARVSAGEPGAWSEVPEKGAEEEARDDRRGDFVKLLGQLSEPHRTMVSLIAATGLRIGELLALRWSSLDLEVGALTVRESVFEGKFQAPKTQRALRTIPLGSHSVKALNDHQARVARKGDDALVFSNRNGAPLRESTLLTNVLQPAAEAAGLGRVTWHQFRHIHSSLLNNLNVPVKIAQEQLVPPRSTSTRTPLTRRTGKPSRQSSANCSSFWTTVDYKRRQGWKTFRPQVIVSTELRIGGAARI